MLILEARSEEIRAVVLQEARVDLLSTTILGFVCMVTPWLKYYKLLTYYFSKTTGHQINIYNVSTKCQAQSLAWRYEKLVGVI